MFLIAAVGMLFVGSFRPSPVEDEDDDFGLFIGSAGPQAAKPRTAKEAARRAGRSQKRAQLI
jgi:hypothetical protein